jgi:hypothetical protein
VSERIAILVNYFKEPPTPRDLNARRFLHRFQKNQFMKG